MSPYPVQTDRETIIETARILIERDSVESLSLGKIAEELGIKAPSLYRHVASKTAILQAVIEQTYMSLFRAFDEVLESAGDDPAGDDPIEKILKLSQIQRTFALENPRTYTLAYTAQNPELRTNPDILLKGALSLQKIIAQISGEEDSLPALRGLLALVHGFVTLELNGQFQRGGDLSATFDTVIQAYLQGWK